VSTKLNLDPDRLRRINSLLEVLLSLPQGERESWLGSLPETEQLLVPTLRAMLARAGDEADPFMRRPVAESLAEYASAEARDDQPGDQIGPYRLVKELGAGGMATVWLAERVDGVLQRQVALKLPRASWGRGLAERMAREREILGALEHPRIARLYDAGVTAAGRPWMALECVIGAPIDRYCEEQKLDVRQRLLLFLQVAEAVAHAHGRLVVHRDLKPSNILVTPEGEVRLLDFGVATLLEDEAAIASNLTKLTGPAVTPGYASPEQLGTEPITVATDVYSLGIVLYELLVGRRPYEPGGSSAAALGQAILSAPVPLASTQVKDDPKLARQLRGDIDTVLAKALQKEASERYSSVESFAGDLQRHLAGLPVLARSEGGLYRAGKFLRRNLVPLAAAGAVGAALILGLGVAIWQAREATRQSAIAHARQARSQASADFMLMVLTDGVRPDEALTLDKLVDRSVAIAEHDFSTSATERAVAADVVSDWLVTNDRYDRALQVLTRAIDGLPKGVDPTLVHSLRCQRAAMQMGVGQTAPALQEFEQMLTATADDPEASWYCLQRRTSAALQLNDAPGALRFSREALRQFGRSGNDSPLRSAYLVSNEAYAEMLNAHPARADQLFRESTQLLVRASRAESTLAVSIYNDWAIALWNAGDPRAALEKLDHGVQITAGHSPDGAEMATSYANRAHALRALGRFDEAAAAFERVRQLAHRDNNPSQVVYALAGETVVAVRQGQSEKAQQLLGEASDELRRAALPSDGTPALWLHMAQALLWQSQGQLAEADKALADVQSVYARRQAKTGVVAETFINRAEIALALGRVDDAQAHAEHALALARASQGDLPYSFIAGEAWLALAKCYRARGATGEASNALHHAGENLRSTLGPSNPVSQQVEQLDSSLSCCINKQ
jgi:serine/threonine-protein kinase